MSHLLHDFALHATESDAFVANNDNTAAVESTRNEIDAFYLRNPSTDANNVQSFVPAPSISARNNNHNDYVNFNQFMMQHNFFGNASYPGNSGFFEMPANLVGHSMDGNGAIATVSGLGTQQTNGSYFMDPRDQYPNTLSNSIAEDYHKSDLLDTSSFYGLQTDHKSKHPTNHSFNNPFAYHNAPSTTVSGALASHENNSSSSPFQESNSSLYPNLYSDSYVEFSNDGKNQNFYTNPFATGFDLKSTKLQADAKEFVPRFDNLSLNDNQNKVAKANQDHTAKAAFASATPNACENNCSLPTSGVKAAASVRSLANIGVFEDATGGEACSSTTVMSSNYKAANNTNNQQNHHNNNNVNNYKKNLSNDAQTKTTSNKRNGAGNVSGSGGGGRRVAENYERDDYRFERGERGERFAMERYERGERNTRGNRQHRYDNHRQNKRRDDWNRNRDRINGFRVDEKYANENGSSSPLTSPDKKSNNHSLTKISKRPNSSPNRENEKLSQRDKLIRDIETRRLECLVCCESIGSYQSVWSCRSCYHIMHLQCIIKWASSSKSEDGWRCPACQNIAKDVPRDYYCFCGKEKNPHFNRQNTAHSCGEMCGRVEGCSHACTLLCHPGPCPPCQANVKRECGCGKTTKIMQCCLKNSISCDAICGKLLNCELHTCTANCHEGKCEPCAEKIEQHCHCGKHDRQVPCTRDSQDKQVYSCGKPCGKDLTCGNHKCKDCCHAGDCRPCKMSPEVVTSCPCGKMPVLKGKRTSCLDAIPTCEGVCNKTLRCGKATNPHHCTSRCHLGNCPPCNKQTAVKCRCGHMDQMIKCRLLSTRADDARCKKRCTKKRSCGKHKCNQECCIDIDHICPLPCNYTLSCGKHKCDQPCHRGNCPPCYRSSFEELYCECGAEVIYPPVACGTKRPVCKKPCSRAHPCDHPPQHTCHSAATCPPCMILTTKWCFGKHEQRKTIPCSQESFSCGLACNKPLPCGRHKCIKPCHEGPCQSSGEICKQSCTVLRATCGHKCMAPCHDGDCPDTPCKESVEVQCECGNRKQMRSCHDLVREFSRIATAQLASSMAEMQRGNYMELSEILQPVKVNKTNKTLDCNEECRLLERNRRLAIGLQVRNPDLTQKLQTKYSDFIRNFYKRDAVLVKSIHDALTTLVKLAKESKQKSRSHSFPTMNREKRQLVHEMCEMFGVDSVAYDKEPNRNVVATAFKERSWLPATSIMEVMAREAGHRRVPVPSNNAWSLKR